jgi:hypothetical protein
MAESNHACCRVAGSKLHVAGEGDVDPTEGGHRSTLEKIKHLPTPVGVLLVGLGVAGLVLPGPMGTPLIVAGGLVLAPRTFHKVEKYFERRFPKFHKTGLAIVERFVNDLEKRYPSEGHRDA